MAIRPLLLSFIVIIFFFYIVIYFVIWLQKKVIHFQEQMIKSGIYEFITTSTEVSVENISNDVAEGHAEKLICMYVAEYFNRQKNVWDSL